MDGRNEVRLRHGKSQTRLYGIWENMQTRCYNAKNEAYKWYGARGITVCAEWKKNFLSFYDWAIANGYADHLSIDRIDNDKGYYPENCRWATAKEQARNSRRNVVFDGKTVAEWAVITGIKNSTLYWRFHRRLSKEALFSPVGSGKRNASRSPPLDTC